MPTGAKSNILKGLPSASLRNSAMTIFGGVPISVIIPPRIDANESAMSESEGLRPLFFAACISRGMSNARAATLFITADRDAASADMMPTCAASLRDASTTYRASSSMTPEFESPRLMISTSAIITVAGCPKPEKACETGTTPVSNAAINAMKATRS